jgi:hypothetical protein
MGERDETARPRERGLLWGCGTRTMTLIAAPRDTGGPPDVGRSGGRFRHWFDIRLTLAHRSVQHRSRLPPSHLSKQWKMGGLEDRRS